MNENQIRERRAVRTTLTLAIVGVVFFTLYFGGVLNEYKHCKVSGGELVEGISLNGFVCVGGGE